MNIPDTNALFQVEKCVLKDQLLWGSLLLTEECWANINVLIKCDKAVKTRVQNLLADLWNRSINLTLSSQFSANKATVS